MTTTRQKQRRGAMLDADETNPFEAGQEEMKCGNTVNEVREGG